ncbi:MAG: extracellular solute-binding protein [Microbacterium sp.]
MLADVTTQTDNGLALYMRDEGWIEPLSAAQFPDFPADLMFEDVGPLVQLTVPVIGYNTDLLGDFAPASWKDLLDPRLEGEIMIADPRTAATWGQIWYAVLNTPELGASYVEELGATGFEPVASSLVGAEQLTAGQGAVLVASTPSVFDAQIAKGAPIEYFSPTDPAPVSYTSVSLIAQADHPNAAHLFALWLTGEEGSRVMNGAERTASPLGIEGDGVFPLPPGTNTTPPAPESVQEAGEEAAGLLGFN